MRSSRDQAWGFCLSRQVVVLCCMSIIISLTFRFSLYMFSTCARGIRNSGSHVAIVHGDWHVLVDSMQILLSP